MYIYMYIYIYIFIHTCNAPLFLRRATPGWRAVAHWVPTPWWHVWRSQHSDSCQVVKQKSACVHENIWNNIDMFSAKKNIGIHRFFDDYNEEIHQQRGWVLSPKGCYTLPKWCVHISLIGWSCFYLLVYLWPMLILLILSRSWNFHMERNNGHSQ